MSGRYANALGKFDDSVQRTEIGRVGGKNMLGYCSLFLSSKYLLMTAFPSSANSHLASVFGDQIDRIDVPEDNRLRFFFKDGSVIERTWADRSRRESWTPEMRQAAAKRTRRQRRKNQCQE
jgi:hypothetical protein